VVRDRRNEKNYDFIDLKVSNVDKIVYVEKKKELLVGSSDTALLYALNENNERFTNCTFVKYDLIIKGSNELTATK